MQEAQKAQQRVEEAQKRIASMSIEGNAGGGMVTIFATGKGKVNKVKIDPSLASSDSLELLEDLIAAAINDIQDKVKTIQDGEMDAVMENLEGFGIS